MPLQHFDSVLVPHSLTPLPPMCLIRTVAPRPGEVGHLGQPGETGTVQLGGGLSSQAFRGCSSPHTAR